MPTSTSLKTSIMKIAQYTLLVIEGFILLGTIYAFWHHIAPPTPLRDAWYWLLWLAVPVFGLRLKLFGRLWTHTRLHDVMLLLIIITAFNYFNAPFHRESYLAPMARPLLGMWIFVYFIEVTRTTKRLNEVVTFTLGMTFVLATLALTATQWQVDKSAEFWFLIETLPTFDYRATAQAMDGEYCAVILNLLTPNACFNPARLLENSLFSFNPNEIAGALIWLAPLMAAIALRMRPHGDEQKSDAFWLIARSVAGILFIGLFFALLFGQSRFALLGLIVTLTLLVWLAVEHRMYRITGFALIAIVLVIQIGVFFNWFNPATSDVTNTSSDVGVSQRDQNSVNTRLAIWGRGLQMMIDNPTTGVGMYMFRTAIGRDPYQIPYYVDNDIPPAPHAHNEWIHMGAEVGIGGLIVFVLMQYVILRMLWHGWRHGDEQCRTVALAVFLGLLGHMIYGLGDTITLWDRYQFILWWLFGLAGAQYILVRDFEITQSGSDVVHALN